MRNTMAIGARKTKIFVTVSGGVAYPFQETVPDGYEIEVIDYDDIREGSDHRSHEAKMFCTTHNLD